MRNRIFDELTERRRLVIATRLARLEVAGHPALRVSFRLEGTRGYVFGCRAGPSIAFNHLAHELAHAVQFGAEAFERRMNGTGSYVFRVHKVYVQSVPYDEPRTDECTRREVETFAIERHLLEQAGYRIDPAAYAKHVSRVTEFLPDWWTHPAETRLATLTSMLERDYARWTQPRVTAELGAWLDALQARLCRPSAARELGSFDLGTALDRRTGKKKAADAALRHAA